MTYLVWRKRLSAPALFVVAFIEAALGLVVWVAAMLLVIAVVLAPIIISPWFFPLYFCLAIAGAAASDRAALGERKA